MKLTSLGKSKKSAKTNQLLEFAIYIFSYMISFLILESIFDSFQICNDLKFLWIFISVCVIYLLDMFLKSVLITITIPLIGLTFGLFYFVINTIILKLTDWIMGPKLDFTNIFILFFIAILFSIIRFVIEKVIIKSIVKKVVKR